MARYRGVADFKPSFLYPAKSAYQLANGCIQPLNQGRLTIACAKEFPDKDMIAMPEGFRGGERTSFTWGASFADDAAVGVFQRGRRVSRHHSGVFPGRFQS